MDSTFKKRVLEIVRQIPRGETMTYKKVAMAAGSPGAYRAVGTIMRHNIDPTVPCHRVIKSDGTLGNYNRGGTEQKRKMLEEESTITKLWMKRVA